MSVRVRMCVRACVRTCVCGHYYIIIRFSNAIQSDMTTRCWDMFIIWYVVVAHAFFLN